MMNEKDDGRNVARDSVPLPYHDGKERLRDGVPRHGFSVLGERKQNFGGNDDEKRI